MDERQANALIQALAFAQKLKASAASGTIERASPASGMFGRSITGASQGLVSPGHAGEQYDDPTVRNLKSQTQQLIDKYCGPVPPSPPGTRVDDNMGLARRRAFVESFPAHIYDMYKDFRTGGAMDYKTIDEKYRDFGNFNYGAYSTAASMKPMDTLANAEAYSLYSRHAPDQDEDMDMIRKGIAYAQCRLGQ